MKTLLSALRPTKRRMRRVRALRFACFGLALGCVCALCLSALALLVPVMRLPFCMALLCASGAALGALTGALLPVSSLCAAKTADACGLMARAQTALALGGDSPMVLLQRKDAADALRAFSPKKALPFRVPARTLLCALCALALSVGLIFVPARAHDTAGAYEQYAEKMEALAKTVPEKKTESAQDRPSAEELNKILRELAQKLKTSVTPKEALTAVAEAEKRVENLNARAQNDLRSALDSAGMQALSQALESGSASAMVELLSQPDAAQNLSQAASMSQSAQAAQALSQAAQALQIGDLSQAQSALMQGAQSGMDAQSLKDMMDALRAGALSVSGMSASASGASGAGQSGTGRGAGSGAGAGTTNQDMTSESAEGTQPQTGSAEAGYRVTDYETIYDPTRLGDGGKMTHSESLTGQGERMQAQMGAGLGTLDGSVPYNAVVGEYQAQAVQSAQERELPAYARQWVDDYFSALVEAGGE